MAAGGFSFGTPTTTATSGFSFGLPSSGNTPNPGQQTAATNLYSPATTTSNQSFSGFGFQTPKTTGFSLFGQSTSTATIGGLSTPTTFSFGVKPSSTNAAVTTVSSVPTSGFGFGLSATKPGSTPGLGAATLTSSSPAPFSFGLPTAQSPATTTQPLGGLSFGVAPAASASTPQAVSSTQSPFTLGSGATANLKPFGTLPSFGLPVSASSQPSQTTAQLSTGSVQSPLQSSLKLPTTSIGSFSAISGTAGLTTTTTTPIQLGLATTAPQSTLSSLGAPSTTSSTSTTTQSQAASVPSTTNTGFGLNSLLFKSTTASTTTTATTGSVGLSLATTTAISSTPSTSTTVLGATSTSTSSTLNTTSSSKTTTLTYSQLEDLINKWACELEDQERYFLDEADRITQWDQALINNGEKITTLYEKVENCKSEQLQIEKELDLIENQQKELETLLEPLERAANELPPGQLHSDFEREAIFQLANNVDLELEQLLSDLREMADQVNSSTSRLGLSTETVAAENASKDGSAKLIKSFKQSGDGSDALHQLTRILNCHMHSLNWIHHNSQELVERLKSLETSSAP